ncbi:hypothetical protein ACQZ4R_23605 [Agrobacterium vitis]
MKIQFINEKNPFKKIFDITIRIIWCISALAIMITLIDFSVVQWRLSHTPSTAKVESLPDAYKRVLLLSESQNAHDVGVAAEFLYEQRSVSDDKTELGFRNLCLAEDLRRKAAVMGDTDSLQWLINYYGAYNFPMTGTQHYQDTSSELAWLHFRDFKGEAPAKSIRLTKYFYMNSCSRAHMLGDENRIILESSIWCSALKACG